MTTKNYAEQGGDKWVVKGKLEIDQEGQLSLAGIPVSHAIWQAHSSATTIAELKSDFNSLLDKLQSAGLMEKNYGD